ncbi:hypothetical protein ACTXT7_017392 [Hymenolepis weldensis]
MNEVEEYALCTIRVHNEESQDVTLSLSTIICQHLENQRSKPWGLWTVAALETQIPGGFTVAYQSDQYAGAFCLDSLIDKGSGMTFKR